MGTFEEFEKSINRDYSIKKTRDIFLNLGEQEKAMFVHMVVLLDKSSSYQLPKHLMDRGWTLNEIKSFFAAIRQQCDDVFENIETVIEDWREGTTIEK